MNNLTFHWKNYRDNAGVETANRLILLLGYQALNCPDKNFKNFDYAQQFKIYKANFMKLLEYKILERSPLWDEKYKALLTQYYEEGNSEYKEKSIKSFWKKLKNNLNDIKKFWNRVKETKKRRKETNLLKESFYADMCNSIEIHRKKFKDWAETYISWGVFFFIFGIAIFGFFKMVESFTTKDITWGDLLFGECFILIGFLMFCFGAKNLYVLKYKKTESLLWYVDKELCYEKLNDELDLVSSYFTDEAKKRQIIDLKSNYNFKKLSEASEEFGFLIIHGIEEEYFTFDGRHLGFISKNFPKYEFPKFLKCEDFFRDFKRTDENPLPFHLVMKKELDSLIGEDSSRCGRNSLTEASPAWEPKGKDLHNKLLKVLETHRKELEAAKK